ncbi:MAG: hypothetical protein HYV16_08100 [Gammaproteobacteria bacterium]|nr:hypothetical protein [Gammaproteobacteria bacterium]
MSIHFFSLVSPPPPGFDTGPVRKRELLSGALALYVLRVADAEALLPDFRARVQGILLTPAAQYACQRLGGGLWQVELPAAYLPQLREILELPLRLLEEQGQNRALAVEQTLNITRLRGELQLTREDYNRITAKLHTQVSDLVHMQELLRQQLDEQLRDKAALADSEAHLRKLADNLQRSNTDLQRFAYVASHDLQEPLRAVAGCVRLLQQLYEPQLDARAHELISHAIAGALRMQTLINDLLSFSRVESRGKAFAAIPMQRVLDAALANLSAARDEAQAQISQDLNLPTVQGDEGQLVQLLQNLIGNAIKYRGDKPPEIHFGFRDSGEDYEFFVSDRGIGIEPKYFDKIFVIFQRLHTREEYPGTGVGLAICQRVVDRHQGRLWVESTPGQGTSFRFTLPKRPEPLT